MRFRILVPSGAGHGRVLAQVDTDDTDHRFPATVADAPVLKDLGLEVPCKPVSGKADRACGLGFRYRDENDDYVAGASALENDVRLHHVVKGRRRQIGSGTGRPRASRLPDSKGRRSVRGCLPQVGASRGLAGCHGWGEPAPASSPFASRPPSALKSAKLLALYLLSMRSMQEEGLAPSFSAPSGGIRMYPFGFRPIRVCSSFDHDSSHL